MSDMFKLPPMKRPLIKSAGCPFCNMLKRLREMPVMVRNAIEDEAIAAGFVYGFLDMRFIDATSEACAFHKKLLKMYMKECCELFNISLDDLVDLASELGELE